jgi:hypothetical protein
VTLAVTCLVGACHSGGDPAAQPARVQVAFVRGLAGKVDVLRQSAVDWVALADGARLYEDDRMRTFEHAWATLVFDGGSTLRVEQESLISLGGGITVERGSVAGQLHAGLQLKTPTLEAETAASRDIQFR